MSRMSHPSTTEHVYGRLPEEHARLTLQARILRPYTERFFRAAGLVPGMRVLDIGSGIGDVAMLAAEIVGPNGRVVGIDMDPSFLEHARRRAEENGCAPWVTFEQAEVDAFTTSDRFDALVGRYILLYLPDPAATLARLLQSVKPGGIVVCHEVDLTDPHPSSSALSPLGQRLQVGERGVLVCRCARHVRQKVRKRVSTCGITVPDHRQRRHGRRRPGLAHVSVARRDGEEPRAAACRTATLTTSLNFSRSTLSRLAWNKRPSVWVAR